MKISMNVINALFQQEDVEGYLSLGAPSDEYASEATNIASALALLKEDEMTEENIVALLTLEWMESFDLTETDMAPRMEALRRIARGLLENGT